MSQYKLPQIDSLPTLSTEDRAAILGHLFEPCDALNTLCVESIGLTPSPFSSYTDLINHVRDELLRLKISNLQSDQEWLLKILSAHPRLGEKKVETLSEHSKGEQASLGGSGGPTEEAEQLKSLNREYEEKFPAGRSRPVVMEDMRRRIDRGDIEEEKVEAITAMAEIALDRAQKLQ